MVDNTDGSLIAFLIADFPEDREYGITELKSQLATRIVEFQLSSEDMHPMRFLRPLPIAPRSCVFLYGVETAFPDVTGYLNLFREQYLAMPHAILLWLDERSYLKLKREAADFASRSSMMVDLRGAAAQIKPELQGAARAFISYATKDGSDDANWLRNRLHPTGVPIWQDIVALQPGDDWMDSILRAIEQVDSLVVVLTAGAVQSKWVKKEVLHARKLGKRILPVVLDGQLPEMPAWLNRIQYTSLSRSAGETSPAWKAFLEQLHKPSDGKRMPYMAPELPHWFVDRPEEQRRAKQLLLSKSPVAITTALQGAGGFGKTTLAAWVCHDDDVLAKFDDGVLWATLGQQPDIFSELAGFHKALTGEKPDWAGMRDAVVGLRNDLGDRHCLLVVDDVWSYRDLEPFLSSASLTCGVLLTTRDREVASDYERLAVDELNVSESVAMLRAGTSISNQELLEPIAKRMNGWALVLELSARWLRKEMGRTGATETSATSRLLREFDRNGLPVLDRTRAATRNEAVSVRFS